MLSDLVARHGVPTIILFVLLFMAGPRIDRGLDLLASVDTRLQVISASCELPSTRTVAALAAS